MGTPSALTLVDVGVRGLFQELEEVPMTMVGGLDVHRQQITFDYVDDDGLVRSGQIRPATRKTVRRWLSQHWGIHACLAGSLALSPSVAANPHRTDPKAGLSRNRANTLDVYRTVVVRRPARTPSEATGARKARE
jgi:hypothetical protein